MNEQVPSVGTWDLWEIVQDTPQSCATQGTRKLGHLPTRHWLRTAPRQAKHSCGPSPQAERHTDLRAESGSRYGNGERPGDISTVPPNSGALPDPRNAGESSHPLSTLPPCGFRFGRCYSKGSGSSRLSACIPSQASQGWEKGIRGHCPVRGSLRGCRFQRGKRVGAEIPQSPEQ